MDFLLVQRREALLPDCVLSFLDLTTSLFSRWLAGSPRRWACWGWPATQRARCTWRPGTSRWRRCWCRSGPYGGWLVKRWSGSLHSYLRICRPKWSLETYGQIQQHFTSSFFCTKMFWDSSSFLQLYLCVFLIRKLPKSCSWNWDLGML